MSLTIFSRTGPGVALALALGLGCRRPPARPADDAITMAPAPVPTTTAPPTTIAPPPPTPAGLPPPSETLGVPPLALAASLRLATVA